MTTNADKTDVVISISNLNVTRGKREVLANFNLEINKGSVTGLLGPSGCGKTTLMRSIVGLQIIKSGDVQVLKQRCLVANLISRPTSDLFGQCHHRLLACPLKLTLVFLFPQFFLKS